MSLIERYYRYKKPVLVWMSMWNEYKNMHTWGLGLSFLGKGSR